MNDDVTITALLHKYGALSFWDYAAAAPYLKVDMNPKVLRYHLPTTYLGGQLFFNSLSLVLELRVEKNHVYSK